MAEKRTLIMIEEVTDCDTGVYQVGELDFGIRVGPVENYLKRYGYEGKRELLAMLGHLAYQVEYRFQEMTRSAFMAQTTVDTGSKPPHGTT